jgi:hypothetical protein
MITLRFDDRVAVFGHPLSEIASREAQCSSNSNVWKAARTDQLIKRAAWDLEQSRCLVGVEQGFGE